MSNVLLEHSAVVQSSSGEEHEARVCGRERDDGRWEAWLEFEPVDGGAAIRTPAETTQPDRGSLFAWARALSRVYLEGAILRAVPGVRASAPAAPPPRRSRVEAEPEGVLDPFEIYAHGQSLLRRHLEALSVAHLRDIANAHEMWSEGSVDRLTKEELVDFIVIETTRRAPDVAPRQWTRSLQARR